MHLIGVVGAALLTTNCAQQKAVSSGRQIDPKYGVAASPRVVGENDPVPKGGGRELVGKPYVVAGQVYVPSADPRYVGEGLASWYGTAFHGRLTANGEIFDRYSIAAAHPTMPLPSYARVTNLRNGRSLIVRVNDRGPYHANRIMDVSQRAAEALDFRMVGTSRVRVEYVGRASTNGSDDNKLLATLRTDGHPALFPGKGRTMVADLREPGQGVAPPQALAFKDTLQPRPDEPVAAEAGAARPASAPPLVVARAEVHPIAPAIVPAPVSTPAPAAEARPTAPVPLPPERPSHLSAGPTGAPARSPVAQAHPPQRPVYAGLL